MVIQHKKLSHKGGMYIYRTHLPKISSLCTGVFAPLQEYLSSMLASCPDQYFLSGPRSSTLRLKLSTACSEFLSHEVSLLSMHGLQVNFERFRDNHSRVQMFMLEHDKKTVAIEVPLWLHAEELEGYHDLFQSEKELTGHIDVLRIEDNKIWIWDYKPQARKEEFATTQVYFYALMLSKRTNISLSEIMCGYFDEHSAFTFSPCEIKIPLQPKLMNYV